MQRVAWDARPAPVLQPGPGAAAVPPPGHPVVLPRARRAARGDEQRQSRRLAAERAAFDGRPQRNRQVVNDIRGYVAELAAKALDQDALTEAVTTEDKDRVRAHAAQLRRAGPRPDLQRLAAAPATASRPAVARRRAGAVSRWICARSSMPASGNSRRNFGEGWDQAATMMQPVGGMGRIGEAFGRAARRHDHLRRGGPCPSPSRRRCARRRGGTRRTRARACHRGAAGGGHRPAARCCARSRRISARRSEPRSRRSTTCRRSRSPSRPSGASGNWTSDLWRHLLDQPRHHAGLVPVGRHPPAEGHPGRRLYLDRRPRREIRRHDPRRPPRGCTG